MIVALVLVTIDIVEAMCRDSKPIQHEFKIIERYASVPNSLVSLESEDPSKLATNDFNKKEVSGMTKHIFKFIVLIGLGWAGRWHLGQNSVR